MSRRIPLWLTMAGMVAGLTACTADGDDDPPPPSPEATTFAPTSFPEPPDGAALSVAEAGFSESADLLSWGVVIENTSDQYVAFDGVVTVRLLDAEGNQIDEISGEPTDQPVQFLPTLTRVLPGERVGFGNTVPHDGAEVANLDIEIATGFWQPVYDDFWWAHPVTATSVTTADATISFTVDATYTEDMIRGQLRIGGHFTAIFRDPDGAIVGGAKCCHGNGGEAAVEVPPGQSQGELTLPDGVPVQADGARTEVYLPDPQENLPG